MKTAISTGQVTFSIIGNEKNRNFIVTGLPAMEVKSSKNICSPGELILTASAWEHCSPSNYEYVIKDENNVKVRNSINNFFLNKHLKLFNSFLDN